MKRIFISYRRSESSGYSRLVYDRLRSALPDADVFMDVESIPLGGNWRTVLEERIESADVVLVLIGREWLTMTDADGNRRLDDPEDVTRWEITSAQEKGKRIIPVLLEEVPLPTSGDLPGPLSPLADIQAIRIRHETFDAGLETLVARITGKGLRDLLRLEQGRRLLEQAKRWSIPAIAVFSFSILWVGFLDLFTLDTRVITWSLALADTLSPPQLEADIALVAIPGSFDTRAPNARARYGEAVTELAQAGAEAILLDFYFHQSRPGPGDDAFADALKSARRTGANIFFGFNQLDGEKPRAVDLLKEAVDDLGLACLGRRLGYALMMPIAFNYWEKVSDEVSEREIVVSELPGLALLGAAGPVSIVSLNRQSRSLTLISKDNERFEYPFSMLDPVRHLQKSCEALQSDTHAAVILLRLSPIETLRGKKRRTELDDLLAGRFEEGAFKGRTVIIGQETEKDEFTVAYGLGSERRYGYELYADAINTLVTKNVVQPLSSYPQIAVMLVTAAVGAWLGVKLRDRPTYFRRASIVLLILFYMLLSVSIVAMGDILLNVSYDLFALIAAYMIFRYFSRRWLT